MQTLAARRVHLSPTQVGLTRLAHYMRNPGKPGLWREVGREAAG
jgi:hypothetical protein